MILQIVNFHMEFSHTYFILVGSPLPFSFSPFLLWTSLPPVFSLRTKPVISRWCLLTSRLFSSTFVLLLAIFYLWTKWQMKLCPLHFLCSRTRLQYIWRTIAFNILFGYVVKFIHLRNEVFPRLFVMKSNYPLSRPF